MELALIVFRQCLTMALYMAMGYFLFRGKKITIEGSKSFASVLLWLVIPAVLIQSFCVAFSLERLEQLGISALLGAAVLALSMLASRVLYRGKPVEHFATAFSNAGFMGIPLAKACFGEDAVFFLTGFVAFLNVMQWTYGASTLSHGKARMGLKEILLNPICVGLLIGLALFFSGLGARLPSIVQNTLSGVAALNAPLAMLVLGVYLAQTNLLDMFTSKKLYCISAVRLLLIPALTLLILLPLPVDTTIRLTILAGASAPVGANVAVYSQIYGEDYAYACRMVAISTLLSVLTMPIVLSAAAALMQA